MAQLQKGTTYITGDQVTAANLNALVDSGILTPGAVTDQTAKTVPLAADTILLHSAADTALRKTTMTQLFATPQPLGATTPSSVAATTGTFSSTLGVTGVATLGNGAILGTPASGTVTNLTGTASININGTVGATTPSTGAFSTLSATGATRITTNNVYFAGTTTGAANQNLIGVGGDDNTYIQYKSGQSARFSNGVSNQVEISATGAAITGTLSATGDTVIGPTTSAGRFYVYNITAGKTAMRADGVGASMYIDLSGGGANYFNATSNFMRTAAGTTVAEFSSTGLAVTGTLSSTGNLSTTGDLRVTDTGSSHYILIGNQDSGGANKPNIIRGVNGTLSLGYGTSWSSSGGGTMTSIADISSTGLAVTGTVSTTGEMLTGVASQISSGKACIQFNGSTHNGLVFKETATASGASFVYFTRSDGNLIGSIARVTTTDAVVYNTTSDARLKENFRDFTDSGRLIDALKPRVFDWKDSDSNGKDVIGFIAQEEHAADPIFAHIGAVSVGDDDSTTITKQWQRSDAALIPILVAELQSLRKRLAALESK